MCKIQNLILSGLNNLPKTLLLAQSCRSLTIQGQQRRSQKSKVLKMPSSSALHHLVLLSVLLILFKPGLVQAGSISVARARTDTTDLLQTALRQGDGQCVTSSCSCVQEDIFSSPRELGGSGGAPFDDSNDLRFDDRVKEIKLSNRGSALTGVTFKTDRAEYKHHISFSIFQRTKSLTLHDMETVTRITVCTLTTGSTTEIVPTTSVNFVKLYTSFGRALEAGTRSSTCFFVAPSGGDIVGMKGATGVLHMHRLAPINRPRMC